MSSTSSTEALQIAKTMYNKLKQAGRQDATTDLATLPRVVNTQMPNFSLGEFAKFVRPSHAAREVAKS